MEQQLKKRDLQQKQMENIKDVWAKSIKIRQMRQMFSHDFGTTISNDMIHRANMEPYRNNTFLS
jgi:hypothetical protein